MKVVFRCPQCGYLSNPIEHDRIPDHAVIQCVNKSCLKSFSIVGADAQFVSHPSIRDSFRDCARSDTHRSNPRSKLTRSALSDSALRFLHGGNPRWSVSEAVFQCANHLMIIEPTLDEEAAHGVAYKAWLRLMFHPVPNDPVSEAEAVWSFIRRGHVF